MNTTPALEFTVDTLAVKLFDTRQILGQAAAHEAAEAIRGLLQKQQTVNIIFAAAPSQNEFLAGLASQPGIDWERINAFHMDEYVNLAEDAPQRFGNFLSDRLFSKVPLKAVYYLNGNTDPDAECNRYAELLQEYPTDIVCMGIGENCHIAFNDPHVAHFDDPVLVKKVGLDLTSRWQQVHDGCFATLSDVPEYALTLTIPALIKAPAIFCMVPAAHKAEAIHHTLTDEISEQYPSTILRQHGNATLFIDRESGARLAG
ncbi:MULTISPECIES: glucosamine-6-phosphate deaminase [unclassified Spirosoma]|uniref:glucosamine-6-phosphate deaminase n=1 Tax=unclassified Spirosoma TaxID=2621999 RepID=UPI000966FB5C|nr:MULTISPECIES: glucosamine-6-phosphate deaminase [unclassified Spirosoma]MBN8824292.1 glucosamine-6-phosphate deaminase [Spirosoma sp.]OJW70234.1 MAG: glucosamine-6-phosphate deaminase [Spirosoma sp. 48-14]